MTPTQPHGQGKSSFDLVDFDLLAEQMELPAGGRILDLGCGAGNYALALAEHLGPDVGVMGLDLWAGGVDALNDQARQRGLDNVSARVADIGGPLPVDDGSIDICLMATVFHDLVRDEAHPPALAELGRVLRPGGRLVLVEFVKKDGPPGPPRSVRLSPDEAADLLAPAGFRSLSTRDLGPETYLSVFELSGQ